MVPLVLPMPGLLLISVAVAAILVYLPFFAVGYARFAVGYDKSAPRTMLSKLPPYAQRATWAHENAFESMILYAPAAIMAYITGQQSVVAFGAGYRLSDGSIAVSPVLYSGYSSVAIADVWRCQSWYRYAVCLELSCGVAVGYWLLHDSVCSTTARHPPWLPPIPLILSVTLTVRNW
jgi:hypothetical protein